MIGEICHRFSDLGFKMNFITLRSLQTLYRTPKIRPFTSPIGSSANYSCGITNVSQLGIQKTSSFLSNTHSAFSLARGHKMIICSAVAAEFSVFSHGIGIRLVTTQVKAPPQARQKINTLIANGDKTSLRKAVTENMYSALKNEIKLRESKWSKVYWEMIVPVVKIRTLRARLIGVDRSDLEKVFVQLTLEILAKQKFEAYNSEGAVVAGDRSKEVLVRDIWVFEKSLFHEGAFWRLCGRIPT